jgi:hypothetical protein
MQCANCTFVTAEPSAFCPNCGTPAMTAVYRGGPAPARLSGLGTATSLLLGADAVFQTLVAVNRVGGRDSGGTNLLASLTMIATIAVFLTWFFQAYRNAGLWGGRQRRAQGWSIGAWFTPVVSLWFPYQILDDTWHASEPATATRRGPDAVAKAWWACWLLAWITSFHVTHSTTPLPDGSIRQTSFGFFLGATLPSNILTAAAAVLGLVTVGRVTRMQEARRLA